VRLQVFDVGYFENLRQHALLGSRLNLPVETLAKIFELSDSEITDISTIDFKMKGKAKPSLEDKQRRSIIHSLEMSYGLCLAPRHNISRSPGFEQALRQCGN